MRAQGECKAIKQRLFSRVLPLLLCGTLLLNDGVAGVVDPEILYQKGMNAFQSKDYIEAVKNLEAARFINPQSPRYLYQLGVVYYTHAIDENDLDSVERAQLLWREAESLIADSKDGMMKATLRDLVERAEKRKRELSEIINIKQRLSKNPQDIEAGLDYAFYLAKRGEHEEASTLYLQLMKNHPNEPRPYVALAKLVNNQGHILWAEHYYLQALMINPNYKEAQEGISELSLYLEGLRIEGYQKLVNLSH